MHFHWHRIHCITWCITIFLELSRCGYDTCSSYNFLLVVVYVNFHLHLQNESSILMLFFNFFLSIVATAFDSSIAFRLKKTFGKRIFAVCYYFVCVALSIAMISVLIFSVSTIRLQLNDDVTYQQMMNSDTMSFLFIASYITIFSFGIYRTKNYFRLVFIFSLKMLIKLFSIIFATVRNVLLILKLNLKAYYYTERGNSTIKNSSIESII